MGQKSLKHFCEQKNESARPSFLHFGQAIVEILLQRSVEQNRASTNSAFAFYFSAGFSFPGSVFAGDFSCVWPLP